MLNLKSLGPADIPILREYLVKHPRQACDYSICNLMTWGRIYNNQYAIWRDHLILVNPKYDYVFYPVGPGLSSAELLELIDIYRSTGPEAELILIPEDWETTNPDLGDYFQIEHIRDWDDYVYAVESMVNLSGKKLAKKKNLISQFVRNYPDYTVLPITPAKLDVIRRFTQKWQRERNVEGIYLNTEFQAICNTLELWDQIPVDGLLICHHNLISAYAIFSEITTDMVNIHFEKFDPDMKGSAQIINWETARRLRGRYKWINREQDMGLEGLRQAKSSYAPDFMVKFIVGRPL
ncbi:MAG: DUF2156 domain-containing protein [Candidatus Syntrophosphaera sp.]|nr:DUF2156 domain-containing protein [Candidatus Syntrophosphaera sp.]